MGPGNLDNLLLKLNDKYSSSSSYLMLALDNTLNKIESDASVDTGNLGSSH